MHHNKCTIVASWIAVVFATIDKTTSLFLFFFFFFFFYFFYVDDIEQYFKCCSNYASGSLLNWIEFAGLQFVRRRKGILFTIDEELIIKNEIDNHVSSNFRNSNAASFRCDRGQNVTHYVRSLYFFLFICLFFV